MKHWTERDWIALDTETTGTDPKTARILQAAIIHGNADGSIDEEASLVKLVNPGVEIPAEATAIHGITAVMLTEAEKSDTAILQIFRRLQWVCCYPLFTKPEKPTVPIVIYNAPYDLPLLMNEVARFLNPVEEFKPTILDPLVIDRALDKYRKGSRNLEATAARYGVQLNGAHDAGSGARAALGIMRALIVAFPQLRDFDLPALQDQQARWYAEWRDHLNEYWERTGKKERVTGTWPMGEVTQ